MFVRCYGLVLLLALVVTGPARSTPPALTVPASVRGTVGAFVTVPAATAGKNVVWYSLDPGLNVFPPHLLKDSYTAVVTSGKPGTYRLLAVTAVGDELSAPTVCTVVITATAGETPTAETAPAETPPPPTPTDSFVPLLYRAAPVCGPNGCFYPRP